MPRFLFVLNTILLIIISGCTPDNQSDKNKIIARVGDKTISLQEFVQRSEYTIRPPYCRNNDYIHKKIILNSLIAEKLLALEAGDNNDLIRNADFFAYLQGRKEQAMRQIQFYEEAYKQVVLTDDEIRNEYKVAGRTYDISYFSLPEKMISGRLTTLLNQGNADFDKIYFSITGDSAVPKKQIQWQDPEEIQIHRLLFKDNPEKNKILGPIITDDNKYLFIRIDGWTDRVFLSEKSVLDRKKTVTEKLTNERAWENYKTYAAEIMRHKKIQFYPETFEKLVTIAAPIYIKSEQEKEKLFNNAFWKEMSREEIISELPKNLNDINHLPLFSIDGKIWNVEKLRTHIKIHPLVFRKEDVRIKNFAEQFKLAIVDMVRDYFITQDAYEKGYDKSALVEQNVNMWKDNMVALYQKYQFIYSNHIEENDQLKIVKNYLTPYIDTLQIRYNDIIEINIPELEKVELSTIDMLAIRPDQPFPVVVPSFPLVTTDNRLDYGKIMKSAEH